MTEPKFTPGPWRLFNGTDVFPDDGDTSGEHHIADCNMTNAIDYPTLKANARLIAAAPDLYAALQAFAMYYPMGINLELDETVRKARAALAKARGQS